MRGLRGRGSRAMATTLASTARPMPSRDAMSVKVGSVWTPILMKT